MHSSSQLRRGLLGLVLGLPLLGLVAANVQQDEPIDPLGVLGEKRKPRQEIMEDDLIGCWNLMLHESPDIAIDQSSVKAFLTFQDGYATIFWRAALLRRTFLGGSEIGFAVQSQVLRYRVSEFLKLQTAPVHSLDNFSGDLVVGGPMEPAEYGLSIEDQELVLTKTDGTRMTFRKVASERFPERALRRLNATRGGQVEVPRDGLDRRR